MTLFGDITQTLEQLDPVELTGTISEVRGLTLLVSDLSLPVGSVVRVESTYEQRLGEVVGFDDEQTIVMLMGQTTGIRRGDQVIGVCGDSMARVGDDLLGRVVDGLGKPIDDRGVIRETVGRPLHPKPIESMQRVPIDEPLSAGLRVIDGMLTVGRGQRLGIFSGPGVGKSSLLGQIARNTDAPVSVIALIGERGREVNDFIHNSLGEEGLKHSVVVVATSDEPVLMRIRAAHYALSVAEYFRDSGRDVVLIMDSVTRFCQAQRQIGLAVGEPPSTKGYTPSVFAMLPNIFERCGRTSVASITGFFAILVEGDDMNEPISDACKGILDGHVVLSRDLANKAHWPAIDVLGSISRVANDVTTDQHKIARNDVLKVLASYRDVEDLVNIGAYAQGSNLQFDLAIAMIEPVKQYLQQSLSEGAAFEQNVQSLMELALKIESLDKQLAQGKPVGQRVGG